MSIDYAIGMDSGHPRLKGAWAKFGSHLCKTVGENFDKKCLCLSKTAEAIYPIYYSIPNPYQLYTLKIN